MKNQPLPRSRMENQPRLRAVPTEESLPVATAPAPFLWHRNFRTMLSDCVVEDCVTVLRRRWQHTRIAHADWHQRRMMKTAH